MQGMYNLGKRNLNVIAKVVDVSPPVEFSSTYRYFQWSPISQSSVRHFHDYFDVGEPELD